MWPTRDGHRRRIKSYRFSEIAARNACVACSSSTSARDYAGLTRKEFIREGAAAFGGSVLAKGLLTPDVAQAATARLKATDLTFATTAQYRPFEIVASGFAAFDDGFSSARGGYETFAPEPESNLGTLGLAGGVMSVSGKKFFALIASGCGPVAPWAAVEVDIAAFSTATQLRQNTVKAGLIADEANYVVASYNQATQTVAVEVVLKGQPYQPIQESVGLATPFKFAFVLNANNVVALADTGRGFVPLARANVASVLDMRDPATLRRFRYGFGARADSGMIALDRVRAGYWGKAGVRDPHVITWSDGTPFIANGKVYLTLTNAGLGPFRLAHWGVYTLDLSDNCLEQIGKLFWHRDGLVVGDHGGHIVYDETIGAFRILVSGWGTFTGHGVVIRAATVQGDILHGVHVVQNPTVQQLPTTVSRWDPHMVCIHGVWYVAFVESPSQNPFRFHPALAIGRRSGRFGNFSLVGRDTTHTMTEGMIMQKIGGKWYVLCSSSPTEGPPAGGHYGIYDLNMRFAGFLDAPYPKNAIPHPAVFPVPVIQTQSTRYQMVTFEGTQYYENVIGYGTHGDFLVMQAADGASGYEFAPRPLPPMS
jgi:hypothetical protein